MTIKASARSAMLFAAGILVSLAGPAPAIAAGADSATVSKSESATSDKSVRQRSRYLKKRAAHREPARAAAKSDESTRTEVADASSGIPRTIPDWLANTNAQMTAADAPADGAKDSAKAMSAAMSEKASTVLQTAADQPADAQAPADTAAAGADQPSDLDRALHETPASAASGTPSVVMASTSRPSAETVAQASNDSSTLDKTSMIGKIFIAVGALLTVASAARMFMA